MQTEQQRVVDVQVHRLGAKLLFDEHGLSPYWGMVSVFDPALEGDRSGEHRSRPSGAHQATERDPREGDRQGN